MIRIVTTVLRIHIKTKINSFIVVIKNKNYVKSFVFNWVCYGFYVLHSYIENSKF